MTAEDRYATPAAFRSALTGRIKPRPHPGHGRSSNSSARWLTTEFWNGSI
jgi:hypothetical protein